MKQPNDVWSADYKGEFKTRDGRWCYPLTIADGHSRYLLACRGRRSLTYERSRPVFEEAFHQHGLPRQMLTDNGTPFVTRGLTGLTRLSVWWIELGIHPIRIQPGRPDQNGRHERMHRTLKEEIYPPAGNLGAQQRRLNRFRQEYNELRPHHALDLRPPALLYEPSPRPYPRRVPPVEYPKHFLVQELHVDGRLYWHGRRTRRISKALARKPIGLEAIEEDVYRLYYGPVLLGVFNTTSWAIHA
jgi:transposase InsO family protein